MKSIKESLEDEREQKVKLEKVNIINFFMNAFARRFDLTASLLNGNLLRSFS